MTFYEFARSIDGQYIICESYDERDAVVEYFSRNGVDTDTTMRNEMHTKYDRWIYPYYDSYDKEIHACSTVDEDYEDCVRFSDIADVIYGDVYAIVIPEMSGLLT